MARFWVSTAGATPKAPSVGVMYRRRPSSVPGPHVRRKGHAVPRACSKTSADLETSCLREMFRRRSMPEWFVTGDGCAARTAMWCSTGRHRRRQAVSGLRRFRLCSRHHRTAHQNDSRKRFCDDGIEVLAGEKNSPFVRAVTIAEAPSLVTNLGTQGIGYINGDLSAAFSRMPVDDWICVQADSHWASDGIAVGTATLFDHRGAFGAIHFRARVSTTSSLVEDS
jgi:hypothetical protein